MALEEDTQAENHPTSEYPNSEPYEPDINIKESYLLLRKNEFSYASLKLPGLFSYRLGHDKLLFALGFIFETIATLLIWFLASTKFSSAIVAILIGLGCVVLIDYMLCWIHQHAVLKKLAKKNNKKLLLVKSLHNDHLGYAAYINTLEAHEPTPKFMAFMFKALIWILVSFRMIGFVSLALGSSIFYFYAKTSGAMAYSGLMLVCLLYFGVGWIHTHYTGYALAGWWHGWLKNRDRRFFYIKLNESRHIPYVVQKTIDLRTFVQELKNDPAEKCRQVLITYDQKQLEEDVKKGFNTDANMQLETHGMFHTPYHPNKILSTSNVECCIIKVNGFFDDDCLYKMINQQETLIAKYAIAIHGIAIQLELLEFETRPTR